MTSYNETKSKRIIEAIIEVVKSKDADIDTTTLVSETDLKSVLNELRITDFNYNYVKGLKRNLEFEKWKVVFKDNKVLKVEKDNTIYFSDSDVPDYDY
jgi:hypothetical protein